jgi:hypothetical protein
LMAWIEPLLLRNREGPTSALSVQRLLTKLYFSCWNRPNIASAQQ